MAKHFNISGELTQQLVAPGDNFNVSKVSLINVQKVSKCKVDLYIEQAAHGKFYLLKAVELPVGATLIYSDTIIDTSAGEFGLYIKLNMHKQKYDRSYKIWIRSNFQKYLD